MCWVVYEKNVLSGHFGNKATSKINIFKESDWITAVQNPKPGNKTVNNNLQYKIR